MAPISLSLIVAMTLNRVIGNRGTLPWKRLPSDMYRFRNLTMATGTVIMGRKTWESLPKKFRPLPERINIVLTRGPAPAVIPESVYFVSSVEEACAKIAIHGGNGCVMGGEEVYKLFLVNPNLKKIHLTVVHESLPGEILFPGLGRDWQEIESSGVQLWDPGDEHETSYHVFERL